MVMADWDDIEYEDKTWGSSIKKGIVLSLGCLVVLIIAGLLD